jgi:hypothetical protein
MGEITKRQSEYAAKPQGIFTSVQSFAYWERRGQRARRLGPAQFLYGVKNENGFYKIHHFDGVV